MPLRQAIRPACAQASSSSPSSARYSSRVWEQKTGRGLCGGALCLTTRPSLPATRPRWLRQTTGGLLRHSLPALARVPRTSLCGVPATWTGGGRTWFEWLMGYRPTAHPCRAGIPFCFACRAPPANYGCSTRWAPPHRDGGGWSVGLLTTVAPGQGVKDCRAASSAQQRTSRWNCPGEKSFLRAVSSCRMKVAGGSISS